MYGYDRKSEYARLRAAAEQGRKVYDELVAPTMRNYGQKGKKGLTERPGETDQLRLLYALAMLHAGIAHDGRTWQQYPYDMLAHIAMLGEGCVEERRQKAFDLCRSWEITAAMLSYTDRVRRLYENEESNLRKNRDAQEAVDQKNIRLDALAHALKHPEAQRSYEELQAELWRQEKETRPRITYDVFDQKISYNERIARWQEDNTISNQPDTAAHVVLPELFWSETYMKHTPNDAWMELAVFSCMLYRHLKAMGVTAQQLEEKDKQSSAHDYWVLAGGSEGFGLYQRRIQPESFFARVKDAIDALRCPPVRLVMANDVWMAWMSPAVYRAFEEAETAVAELKQAVQQTLALPDVLPDETVDDDEWKLRCVNALSAWMTVPKQPVETICIGEKPDTEEKRYCLYTVADGGLTAATSLHARMVTIRNSFRERNAEDKNNLLYIAFRAAGNGDAARWLNPDETAKADWISRVASYVKQLAAEPDAGSKPQRCDLRLMGSAKNWQENAARLLLGYLAWCSGGKYACELDGEAETLAAALADAIRRDDNGTWYLDYCRGVKPGMYQLLVRIIRDEQDGEAKLCLEVQQHSGLVLTEEATGVLYTILTAKADMPGEWTVDAIRRELDALDAYTGLCSENIPIAMNKRARTLGCFMHSKHEALEFGFSWEYFGDAAFPREAAIDVIRHEYAHYMNFVRGNTDVHGEGWRRCCEEIGAVPEATYNEKTRLFLAACGEQEQPAGDGAAQTAETLNGLFAQISTFLYTEDKLHGKIDLERVLYRDANNRLANDAKAYFMLVMQWWLHRGAGRSLAKCSLVMEDGGNALAYLAGDTKLPLAPFGGEADVQSFFAYVEDIRHSRILRALKITKTPGGEAGCYDAGMCSVSGKLSDAEQATLNAVMLQGGKDKDSQPNLDAYRARLAALDCNACNTLLEKGLNVLKERGKAAYESAHLIELPARELPANDRALRFLLLALLYRISDGKLYEGDLALTQQGKLYSEGGQEIALEIAEEERPAFCAFLEKLYTRRGQTNVKYDLTLGMEGSLYAGEIVNKSRKVKEEKKAKRAA